MALLAASMAWAATTNPSEPAAATQPAEPPAQRLDAKIAAAVQAANEHQTCEQSPIRGGAFAGIPFYECSPDGILIGFRIGLSKEMITRIQAIYLTPAGETYGSIYGSQHNVSRVVITKAPPDFAVGAIEIHGGGGLDALKITYMRINGTRLDPTDTTSTPRIGGGGGGSSSLDGDGTPIIGICGATADKNQQWLGLGVIFEKPLPAVIRRY
jgi:hypothetical protein